MLPKGEAFHGQGLSDTAGLGRRIADGNRALFDDKGIFVIKLMSSPCEGLEEWFDLIGIMIEDFKKSHP